MFYHYISKEFPFDNLTKGIINCSLLYKYVKAKRMESIRINISELKYGDTSYIKELSERYKRSDLNLPCLVVDFGDYYRLIDGKHRLKKTINNDGDSLLCYILTKREALRFLSLKGCDS